MKSDTTGWQLLLPSSLLSTAWNCKRVCNYREGGRRDFRQFWGPSPLTKQEPVPPNAQTRLFYIVSRLISIESLLNLSPASDMGGRRGEGVKEQRQQVIHPPFFCLRSTQEEERRDCNRAGEKNTKRGASSDGLWTYFPIQAGVFSSY